MTLIDGGLPNEYAELHDMAVQLVQEPAVAAAVSLLLSDDDLARKLARKPSAIGELLGFDIPKGLDVRLVGLGKPGPDWVPFSVRLTGCRHYWIRQKDQIEEVEICRGIEIVPNPVPGGPWG